MHMVQASVPRNKQYVRSVTSNTLTKWTNVKENYRVTPQNIRLFCVCSTFFAISSFKEKEKATRIITKQTIQIAGSAFATFKVHYWNNYSG